MKVPEKIVQTCVFGVRDYINSSQERESDLAYCSFQLLQLNCFRHLLMSVLDKVVAPFLLIITHCGFLQQLCIVVLHVTSTCSLIKMLYTFLLWLCLML